MSINSLPLTYSSAVPKQYTHAPWTSGSRSLMPTTDPMPSERHIAWAASFCEFAEVYLSMQNITVFSGSAVQTSFLQRVPMEKTQRIASPAFNNET